MAGWIKTPLGREVGLGPSDIVLDGNPAPLPKKGGRAPSPPKFSAHVYCGQTAGWIKMPFGMEVGLGPGHTVLDEDSAPLISEKTGHSPPNFRPMSVSYVRLLISLTKRKLLWPNGRMDQDATCYGGMLRPRTHCVKWGPRSP